MTFRIYRRHNREKCDSKNPYDPRCGCPLSVQFGWAKADAVFEGKKLTSPQAKWSLGTRSWSEAQSKVTALEKRLKDFTNGKVVPKGMTVQAALHEWYEFRDQDGLDNTKAKLMGGKLVEWCEENNTLLLTALTTDKIMKWRLTLPFRSGDSSSLSVHWSVISGFFSWAAAMGYIEKSPIPNPKVNRQFRIRYKKAEVKPPTKKQVEKILATATGQVRLLCQLMRETAMALVDAIKYGMSQEDAEKFGMSKPERRPVIQDKVIRGNRTKTNERYRVRISESLAKQLEALGEPVFPGTYSQWRERVNKVINDAAVKTTPHGFRHFRITEWLSAGVHVDDVADMVGTSSKEIRETYRHWIKEAEDRLDEVQRQAWLKMGLDENGNAKKQHVQ
jgi:integrase